MRVCEIFLAMSLICLLQCGFRFLERVSPLPNMPEGDPDPNAGIVLRYNSDALRFLEDTSKSIRWLAFKTTDEKRISRLETPMGERSEKRFRFLGEKLKLDVTPVHQFSVSFNDKTQVWRNIRFYSHEPSEHRSKEQVSTYLEKWHYLMAKAGWPMTYGPKTWLPEGRVKQLYAVWETKHCKLSLLVRRVPSFPKPGASRGYVVTIYIDNMTMHQKERSERTNQ